MHSQVFSRGHDPGKLTTLKAFKKKTSGISTQAHFQLLAQYDPPLSQVLSLPLVGRF